MCAAGHVLVAQLCRCCSVAKLCPTLCDPMDCRTPGPLSSTFSENSLKCSVSLLKWGILFNYASHMARLHISEEIKGNPPMYLEGGDDTCLASDVNTSQACPLPAVEPTASCRWGRLSGGWSPCRDAYTVAPAERPSMHFCFLGSHLLVLIIGAHASPVLFSVWPVLSNSLFPVQLITGQMSKPIAWEEFPLGKWILPTWRCPQFLSCSPITTDYRGLI